MTKDMTAMEATSALAKLWTCPECGRQFERPGQVHSCKIFSLEQHFEGKPVGKALYDYFEQAVTRSTGPFKIESLECCIHFVGNFAFVAVKILTDKIRIDFSLARKIKSKRFGKHVQMSAHRHLYYVDIEKEDEIDPELMLWIKEARNIEKRKQHPASK